MSQGCSTLYSWKALGNKDKMTIEMFAGSKACSLMPSFWKLKLASVIKSDRTETVAFRIRGSVSFTRNMLK
jgi:hypothetical protein